MGPARREGLKFLAILLAAILLILLLPSLVSGALATVLALAFLFTFYFFRDPERLPPPTPRFWSPPPMAW